MRILFDSKNTEYKKPFGVLHFGEACTINIDVPEEVAATGAEIIFTSGHGKENIVIPMQESCITTPYVRFSAVFELPVGLYFYYFVIHKHDSSFRLFRYGRDTNMEAGDMWQVSCIPNVVRPPEWSRGAVVYQIFPDRFFKEGCCDLTGKLTPYSVHESWEEPVDWRPNRKGEITNTDFYGGNLQGIISKLDYIKSLGTNIIYLNPIFLAWSYHRYDTADYKVIDPMLGTESDFRQLCREAHARNIKIILDGVFSHTGDRCRYFQSAIHDRNSEYVQWYTFRKWPDNYLSWWDFKTLPCLNKTNPDLIEYMIKSDDSVVARWLAAGADGWRLDVADELPDGFLSEIKKRIRQVKPDALLIGEVWEDASNKIAYDQRRSYFISEQLDSVMNYPFRTAILEYVTGKDDGSRLAACVEELMENYPPEVLESSLTLLSTHDTPRLLTALTGNGEQPRDVLAGLRILPQEKEKYLNLQKKAAFLQFMLPGAPTVFYGDEAEMEGGKDPFCRKPYPWGKENKQLLHFYQELGNLRNTCAELKTGMTKFLTASARQLIFSRGEKLLVCINDSDTVMEPGNGRLLLGMHTDVIGTSISVEPGGYALIQK